MLVAFALALFCCHVAFFLVPRFPSGLLTRGVAEANPFTPPTPLQARAPLLTVRTNLHSVHLPPALIVLLPSGGLARELGRGGGIGGVACLQLEVGGPEGELLAFNAHEDATFEQRVTGDGPNFTIQGRGFFQVL